MRIPLFRGNEATGTYYIKIYAIYYEMIIFTYTVRSQADRKPSQNPSRAVRVLGQIASNFVTVKINHTNKLLLGQSAFISCAIITLNSGRVGLRRFCLSGWQPKPYNILSLP